MHVQNHVGKRSEEVIQVTMDPGIRACRDCVSAVTTTCIFRTLLTRCLDPKIHGLSNVFRGTRGENHRWSDHCSNRRHCLREHPRKIVEHLFPASRIVRICNHNIIRRWCKVNRTLSRTRASLRIGEVGHADSDWLGKRSAVFHYAV
jgi:hypothetical protein